MSNNDDELTVGIYVPSYKRYDNIMTYHIFEKCKYLVRKSQAIQYENAGIAHDDIWAVDDELINSGSKAYFYAFYNAPEDIIVVADDDIEDVIFRLDEPHPLNKNKEMITDEIYRIAQLVWDLGIGLASNPHSGPLYNYDMEFGWKGIPGAIKWVNRRVFKAKRDPEVSNNFDIDMIMQELLVNRITLIPKFFLLKSYIDTLAGGASERMRQEQIDSINRMKLKWGKYFSYDFKKNKPKINVKR